MDVLASLYPALTERKTLPAYYTPFCLGLCLVPFLTKKPQSTVSIFTFPLLLYLCAHWPYFTTGDPSSDYYNNSHFIAIPLWYLDFVLLTSWDGEEEDTPAFYVGPPLTNAGRAVTAQRQRWKDLSTFSQRMKWAIRLMLPPAHRGIGWNWQVKGVPPLDWDASLSKWQYVSRQIWWMLFFYAQSVGALVAVGFGYALRAQLEPNMRVKRAIATAITGWLGALWVWDRLSCAYHLIAAIGVGTGATATWEWPPLMGALKDAWSVRQMWSATYHQVCRRLLSQPSARIVRFLGIRRGSLASSYSQLFLSFGISCLFHQAQMFNVTRKDMGELAFFMSQPLAIITEDLVCWVWKRSRFSGKSKRLEILVGYFWTFAWFSFSLQLYVGGLIQARVIKDWVLAYRPLEAGVAIGQQLSM